MASKEVKADLAQAVENVVKKVENLRGSKKENTKNPDTDKEYKGVVEAVLTGVATRIVLSSSYKELGATLEDTLTTIRRGGADLKKIDILKARVLDSVRRISDGDDSEVLEKQLQALFKKGKYDEAATLLKEAANHDLFHLSDDEKQEINGVLDKVKPESAMSEIEVEDLAKEKDKVVEKNEKEVNKMRKQSEEAELELEKAAIFSQRDDDEYEPTTRTVDSDTRDKVYDELRLLKGSMEGKDQTFIKNIFLGQIGDPDRVVDFSKLDKLELYHTYMRVQGIKYNNDLSSSPELNQLLDEMFDSARSQLLQNAENGIPSEVMTPDQARWLGLSQAEQDRTLKNLDFLEESNGDYKKLLQKQREKLGDNEVFTKTDQSLIQLLKEYAEKNPDFELEKKLHQVGPGRWTWSGSREDLFDVCREEVYGIQGQITHENMGNLVFEESAQKYLALMRIDVGDDIHLETVKEAITKALYIDFSVKTMWRSGGNIEAWQRAAGVLTPEGPNENFFQIMKIGERLQVTDREGNRVKAGRFDWEDIMNVAEMKASNGQYFHTFMAGQSTATQIERWPEFAGAVMKEAARKRWLRDDISESDYNSILNKVDGGEYAFTDRQMRSMVNYLHYLEVATFRGGEFGLNQATNPDKFDFIDLPCGEVVQKTGPWSIMYNWHYPVTKYGGEWIGKLFLPNVNLLSYSRSETLGHFLAKDSKVVAGMRDEHGEYTETGVGASEFFFGSGHLDSAEEWGEFWGDVIFDTRTGGISEAQQKASIRNKNSINRTVDQIRVHGEEKLNAWRQEGKLGFVEHLEFDKFEKMLGHEIPGSTKMEKFEWMTKNFDYSFWRKDLLKSKRIGDWVNKYVPKKYEDARVKLSSFLNAPGTATLGAVRDTISEYSDESGFNEMAQWIIGENRKFTAGRKWVGPDNLVIPEDVMGTLARREGKNYVTWNGKEIEVSQKFMGYKHADRGRSKWMTEGAGDFWGVTEQWHKATEGYHWGSGLAMSRQQGKEQFNDPMYFEKMEIDNQFHVGMLSREEWGKAKREWQAKAYFGQEIEINGVKFRPGYVPVLTPLFLFRGWWVDRMELDWEDFMMAFHKNNEEAWEKLKKIIGI